MQGYYNGTAKFGHRNRNSGDLEITLEFRDRVECSGQDLTDCRNAWASLPPLQPPLDLEKAVEKQDAGGQPAAGADPAAAESDQV